MLSSLATHILVSYIAELLFSKKIIPVKYDFLGCFKVRSGEVSLASLSHNDSAKQLKKAKGTAKKVDTTQKSAADDSEANTSMKHSKKNDSWSRQVPSPAGKTSSIPILSSLYAGKQLKWIGQNRTTTWLWVASTQVRKLIHQNLINTNTQ